MRVRRRPRGERRGRTRPDGLTRAGCPLRRRSICGCSSRSSSRSHRTRSCHHARCVGRTGGELRGLGQKGADADASEHGSQWPGEHSLGRVGAGAQWRGTSLWGCPLSCMPSLQTLLPSPAQEVEAADLRGAGGPLNARLLVSTNSFFHGARARPHVGCPDAHPAAARLSSALPCTHACRRGVGAVSEAW
jgi:hypothetical protein